jgi:hypothetical protein
MAYLETAADLKRDALGLAAEPDDGLSQYDADVYEWLTVVQRVILSGGQFGPSALEPMDWGWARAWPRGTIQLQQPFNRVPLAQATFAAGGQTVALSLLASIPNLVGWRIARTDVAARHLITGQVPVTATTMTLTLQDPWTGPADATTAWWAYPDTYKLPTDFVRGCSPLFVSGVDSLVGPGQLDLLDPAELEHLYPHSIVEGGMPYAAARVTHDRIRLSHYLDTPTVPRNVQVEFEYIRRPPVLAEGSIPLLPVEHRRILSYGAAFLILNDRDDSSAKDVWGMFEAAYKAMRDEEVRDRRRMSSRWGVVQPARAISRMDAGLPVYYW